MKKKSLIIMLIVVTCVVVGIVTIHLLGINVLPDMAKMHNNKAY